VLPANAKALPIEFLPQNKRHASGGPSSLSGLPLALSLLVEVQGAVPYPEVLTDLKSTTSAAQIAM